MTSKAKVGKTDFKFIDSPSHISLEKTDKLTKVKCKILGTPRPLARARARDGNGKTWYWNPSKPNQDSFHNALKQALESREGGNPFTPSSERAISLSMKFFFPRPKHHYNLNWGLKDTAPVMVTSYPDLDNLEKLILDAIKGLVYEDDRYVSQITSSKHYLHSTPGRIYKESDNKEGCVLLSITEFKRNHIALMPKNHS